MLDIPTTIVGFLLATLFLFWTEWGRRFRAWAHQEAAIGPLAAGLFVGGCALFPLLTIYLFEVGWRIEPSSLLAVMLQSAGIGIITFFVIRRGRLASSRATGDEGTASTSDP